MARPTLDKEFLRASLSAFLSETTDLSEVAWREYIGASGSPSSGTLVKNLSNHTTFSAFIVEVAQRDAQPDRVFSWPLCPDGARHQHQAYWQGTPAEHASNRCLLCAAQKKRRVERQEMLPTFADKHPHLIPYLANADDALSKTLVEFRCARCERAGVRYSPHRWPIPPMCTRCRATGGAEIGDVVARTGGGISVQLEADIARALQSLGIDALSGYGVVVQEGHYHRDVIKPDLVVPHLKIAVELDQRGRRHDGHRTPEGVEDDQLRDRVLGHAGWRVLRVREVDMPSADGWPWSVVTNSMSAKIIARLIVDAISETPTGK